MPMQKQIHSNQKKIMKHLHSIEGGLADSITKLSGSMSFVYFHVLWFSLWFFINQGYFLPVVAVFDPFPYGLLTMIVSLEAIFLSTFIMVAHNRQTLMDEYRDLEEDIEEQEAVKDVEDIQKDLNDLKRSVTIIQKKILNTDTTQSKK